MCFLYLHRRWRRRQVGRRERSLLLVFLVHVSADMILGVNSIPAAGSGCGGRANSCSSAVFGPSMYVRSEEGDCTFASHSCSSSPCTRSCSSRTRERPRRTSGLATSTCFAVASASLRSCVTSASTLAAVSTPLSTNPISSFPPALSVRRETGPMAAQSPNSATDRYARSVARWMSSTAPVDWRWHPTSSAARPPMRTANRPRSSSAKRRLFSSSGGGV
mmetsp:Transcript_10389/g.34165  ORF Transcript_10389/g.34165 Transcript_10389/m.34165 type:complete len:219 (+) Transcript_10389:20-676(+)